ncbi:Kinesin-1-like protein PSS1 [Acorus gramineus]|uniref:Kinesin-like protein n=1 Tax=Acorus gramineus TaxID=55184 RepID=A0AAV9B728_ACOGR|nr:Kinesin-1-like protein PSS1 [Acorus gramineus]
MLMARPFASQDDKEEKSMFCFDRVFYPGSSQSEVYEFIAMPIIQDIMNATNGTIFSYGQGLNFPDSQEKGLLPRVVEGLFESLGSSDEVHCTVKLSMVEIYMEKIRDLLDLAKDNLQILESKVQGIYLSEVTEIAVMDPADALKCLSESTKDGMVKTGKLMLVDLAGSEKIEKTNAQGKVLEEAKSINKSLSSLGKVINALTTGRMNHIPYRDSKITRILQDGLLRQNMTEEDVNLLEQLFVLEGIFFDPKSISAAELEDMAMKTITELQQAVGELKDTNLKLQRENRILKRKLLAGHELLRRCASGGCGGDDFMVVVMNVNSVSQMFDVLGQAKSSHTVCRSILLSLTNIK